MSCACETSPTSPTRPNHADSLHLLGVDQREEICLAPDYDAREVECAWDPLAARLRSIQTGVPLKLAGDNAARDSEKMHTLTSLADDIAALDAALTSDLAGDR